MSAEKYPQANLKWPVVVQDGEHSIEGVTLYKLVDSPF